MIGFGVRGSGSQREKLQYKRGTVQEQGEIVTIYGRSVGEELQGDVSCRILYM